MGPEAGSADSLARAIEDLREELLSWIDAELSRLQGLEQEAMSRRPGSIRSGPRSPLQPLPPAAGDGAGTSTADDVPGMRSESSRNRGWLADRDPNADNTEPPLAAPGSGKDPETQAAPLNPLQRLDALARLLDHRLKQAEGAGRDTARGRGKWMRDEPHELPERRGVEWTSEDD